jgi:hypothetical protein
MKRLLKKSKKLEVVKAPKVYILVQPRLKKRLMASSTSAKGYVLGATQSGTYY